MLTKGAIGNLINRYRAVLTKCNLMNTFGSLAVASMLVLGGAGVAGAAGADPDKTWEATSGSQWGDQNQVGGRIQLGNLTAGTATYDKATYTLTVTADAEGKITLGNGAEAGGASLSASFNDGADNKHVGMTFNDFLEENDLPSGNRYQTGYYGWASADVALPNINVIGGEGTVLNITTNNGDPTILSRYAKVNIGTADKPVDTITLDNSATEGYSTIYVTDGNNKAHAAGTYNGNPRPYEGRQELNIYGNHVTIKAKAEGTAITGNEGRMTLIANKDLTIEGNIHGYNEVYDGKASMTFNINTNAGNTAKTTIKGNINAAEGSFVNIGLKGEDSSITGAVTASAHASFPGGGVTLEFGKGGSVTGNFIAQHSGNITVTGADVITHNGHITVETNGTFTANNLLTSGNVTVDDTSTLTLGGKSSVVGTLDVEDGGVLTVDSADVTATGGTISGAVKATGKANDELGGNRDKLAENLGVALDNIGSVTMAEGLIQGAVDKDGKQKANTVVEAIKKGTANASIALNRALKNDVRKRMGDLRYANGEFGTWARYDGGHMKGDGGFTYDLNTLQFGFDTNVGNSKNIYVGAAFSYSNGDMDFARGSAEAETCTLAAYGVWFGEMGQYADVIARIGHSDTEMNVMTDGGPIDGDINNNFFGLSGEFGWRFDICKSFFLEPQVELAYTYVTDDQFQMSYASYDQKAVDSLVGRVGLVAGWNLPDDRGNVYVRASVLQEFCGDAEIHMAAGNSRTVSKTDGDDTWIEYGIGGQLKVTDKTYVWADIERTEGAELEEEWRGTVGFRVSF